MEPEVFHEVVSLIGVLGSAIIGAIAAIVVGILQRKRDNAEREKAEALREQKQEIKLQEIEAKLDEHNGYAQKFTETHDAIIGLQTDMKWLKEEIRNGTK